MSFLKIDDSKKRDFIVNEFLKSKKNIQQSFLSEKLGDIGLQRELTKLYKPLTETQKTFQETLKTDLGGIKENLQALPASVSTSLKSILPASATTVQFPQYPSIEAYSDDPVEDIRTLELGDLATKYLKEYGSKKELVDKIFGIYTKKDGAFYIGDTPITIQGDDMTVGDITYAGTPGLWELMTMAAPNNTIWKADDMDNYAEILINTNAMCQPNNPNKPKSSKGVKWNTVVKYIWEKYRAGHYTPRASTSSSLPPTRPPRPSVGKGTVVIPQDPNALIEMLNERMASFKAGNTGVRNEVVSICDELLRQGVLDKMQYKKLML